MIRQNAYFKLSLILALFIPSILFAQNTTVEGYVYESGNRGYLNLAQVVLTDAESGQIFATVYSNREGFFTADLPSNVNCDYTVTKEQFGEVKGNVRVGTDKVFIKAEMKREPGYLFDVTMAQKKDDPDEVVQVDAILGGHIEVYNNTKKKEELNLQNYPHPNFQFTFKDGNHYTIMIRKEGFLTKRMEAYVNVNGCILCFEGIGDVRPGVTDNLTEGNEMGTLLANVELDRATVDKTIELQNIYFDYDSYEIRPDASAELDKLITLLRDNPTLLIELGSHTDSRGDEKSNQILSQQRATASTDYLLVKGGIDANRIKARGYGESKLKNRCKSSVKDCTETEHAVNRRTEIKILGFSNSLDTRTRSLQEIREEEIFLESLVSGDGFGGQVQIKEGDKMPAHIEEQTQKGANAEQKLIKEQVEESIEEEPVIEEMPKKNVVPGNTQIADPMKKDVSSEQVPEKKEELPVNTQIAKPMKDDISSEKPPMNDALNKAEQKAGQVLTKMKDPVQKLPADQIMRKADNKEAEQLSYNYTGYKIQVHHSVQKVALNHPIYTKLSTKNLSFEVRANGVSYLVGDFSEKDDAYLYLADEILAHFPDAFLVKYESGKRVK